jgi:hypothetical protein
MITAWPDGTGIVLVSDECLMTTVTIISGTPGLTLPLCVNTSVHAGCVTAYTVERL